MEPSALQDRLKQSRFPVAYAEVPAWGKVLAPKLPPLQRLKIPEYFLIADPVGVGSGYGDPIDRAPEAVLRDVVLGLVSPEDASAIYGVVVTGEPLAVDQAATQARREAIRTQRLAEAEPAVAAQASRDVSGSVQRRVHEYVEIAKLGDGRVVSRCRKCSHVFALASQNYKTGAWRRIVDLNSRPQSALPDGGRVLATLHEYFCPGCATQIDVEIHCPGTEAEAAEAKPVWDIEVAVS